MSVPLPPITLPHRSNRLLATLPPDVFARLEVDLHAVAIAPKKMLYEAGAQIVDVFFPHGGVYSMTTPLMDGSAVEAATVGDEGLVGVEAILYRNATAYGDTMLQVPDTSASRISVQALRRELHRQGALEDLLGRYAHFVGIQIMQSAACNAMHDVRERCCRWLLQTHDRMHRADFPLSQQFLAMMLGTRRQTVSVVAGELQAAGMIQYRHGRMTLLDRAALEDGSCECYSVVKTQSEKMLLGAQSGGTSAGT